MLDLKIKEISQPLHLAAPKTVIYNQSLVFDIPPTHVFAYLKTHKVQRRPNETHSPLL